MSVEQPWVIKLFPIFAITLFLRHSFRQFLTMTSIFAGSFFLYLLFNYDDLPQILATTLKGRGAYAYGTRTLILTIDLWQSYIPMLFIVPAVSLLVARQWRAGHVENGCEYNHHGDMPEIYRHYHAVDKDGRGPQAQAIQRSTHRRLEREQQAKLKPQLVEWRQNRWAN